MLKKLFLLFVLFPTLAFATGNVTGNFFPAPNSTLKHTATTGGVEIQFTDPASVGASDVMIKNGGSVAIYCDIGTGGSGFSTTVPTNTVPGGFLVNPGEADIFNKRANDTVACITSTSTAIFTATPGIGH